MGNQPQNKDIQVIVGNLLRVGVLLSMSIVLVGGVVYLASGHAHLADYAVFNADKTGLKSMTHIYNGVFELRGEAIIQFGLLVLIFTPIARVILAMFSFFLEKDYLYVGIGLLILAIIAVSFSGGFTD